MYYRFSITGLLFYYSFCALRVYLILHQQMPIQCNVCYILSLISPTQYTLQHIAGYKMLEIFVIQTYVRF